MSDKYSYYLSDDDKVKEMDHFQAMQINKDADLEAIKKQMKQLSLQFHPDRNGGSLRAEQCFKRMYQAYEVLSDPKKRAHYEQFGDNDYSFDVNFNTPDFDDLDEALNRKNVELTDLLQRMEKLNTPEAVASMDSLEKITMDLYTIYRGTMVSIDVLQKQFELIKKINEQAKTGDEFYALYLVTTMDPHYKGLNFLQNAAVRGHILALGDVATRAFAGHFNPVKDSVQWALTSLRYLEETIIPKLEKEAPDSETLNTLKDQLGRLRQRRGEVLPLTIPRDSKAFDELVTNVVEYRKKRGGFTIGDFIIPVDMIEKLEKNLPLLPVMTNDKPQDKVSDEHDLLLVILKTFTNKIDELRKDPKHKKSIEIAEQLNTQLTSSINVYINSRLNPELNKDQIAQATKAFIDSCTTAINSAKPLLKKELGWGDFLTNLLKSLVNVAISAVNTLGNALGSRSQFTLFAPAKALLVSDVEQLEQGLNTVIPPKK